MQVIFIIYTYTYFLCDVAERKRVCKGHSVHLAAFSNEHVMENLMEIPTYIIHNVIIIIQFYIILYFMRILR